MENFELYFEKYLGRTKWRTRQPIKNHIITIGRGSNIREPYLSDSTWWVFVWDADWEERILLYREFPSETIAKRFALKYISTHLLKKLSVKGKWDANTSQIF